MLKTKFVVTILVLFFSYTSQFSDELDNHYESSCSDVDALPCVSGGCFHQSQFCDGVVNCDDASDETFCENRTLDQQLCNITHQFSCANGDACIPNSWICNNVTDCKDGSDEANCTEMSSVSKNATCKGYMCGDGKCISNLWVCDGIYDCDDKSDELIQELCRHIKKAYLSLDTTYCLDLPKAKDRYYKCIDSSYCLPNTMMCDGMKDCRDGSDEGSFCEKWSTMCDNFDCSGNYTMCTPERDGPSCICIQGMALKQYNYHTHQCDDVNECLMDLPQCSHKCLNRDGHFECECEPGYIRDHYKYLCYATGPEALLFFSTQNDIRYLRVKTKQMVTVATGVKQAHGVSFDGTYVYWVETAKGHQSIFRAQLDDVKETKQTIVGLGLEEPGDIAVDYLGGNIYFSDSDRGVISACKSDGSICTTLKLKTKHPKYVTLDVKKGKIYWADWHDRAVIMAARMDGSRSEVLVDNLLSFATGLAIDAPNDRLYYVDKTIKVVLIPEKRTYPFLEEPFHHPNSISVFENTVYWSDWTTNTIQMTDKIHGTAQKRNVLQKLHTPVLGMHMYHPALMNSTVNPCRDNNCSHFCFVNSNASYECGCPDGMRKRDNLCVRLGEYRAKYLVVGGGQLFTRVQYDELGNAESHATKFNIGRVQAMAHDSVRDTLYIYDVKFKTIEYIDMNNFTTGLTHRIVSEGLENVVDMDYDYATDTLYILDAGRRAIDVLSLRTRKRAQLYKFDESEVPLSLCVVPDYGRMMVAVVESEHNNVIHVDSIGLDGQERKHVIMNNLRGPHVRLRYLQHMENVFISDESNGAIDYIHPDGSGKETYRELSTTVTSLAVTDNYVFWTDRRTSRLFWSDIHETTHKIRRIELGLFPNNTQLLIQATSASPDKKDPFLKHQCLRNVCSDVCVQVPHAVYLRYRCLCAPGSVLQDGKCLELVHCEVHELTCHRSNMCVSRSKKCDGVTDCRLGEDEEGCKTADPNDICTADEFFCHGVCLNRKTNTMCNGKPIDDGNDETKTICHTTEYQCLNSTICIPRSHLCDTDSDCPYFDDEQAAECNTLSCYDTEFMCTSGSCILKSFRCDGERDCTDGSDEINCGNKTCGPGFFQCRNRDCIEVKQRCDGHQDCYDFSDEEDCEDPVVEIIEVKPQCARWEYTCEHNTSICLPHTARCNMKVECPGGSDEDGCDLRCAPRGMFSCSQELACIAMVRVCNNRKDCIDGSDETPDACALVNRTSMLFPMHTLGDCPEGYSCVDGQCVDWHQVCDNNTDCFDETDEDGLCLTACKNDKCSYACQPTPIGPVCMCPPGYKLGLDRYTCEDIDECQQEVCSQACFNTPGSYRCACHPGYAPRSDRRSCKATKGDMSILYASGNSIRTLSADGHLSTEFTYSQLPSITDIDIHISQKMLYMSCAEAKKILEVNSTHDNVRVTNIGTPTRIALDWVTGNIYFVDSTPSASRLRVCHMAKQRCAVLQKIPSNAAVTALIVDPGSHRMFYCVTRGFESVVWSASLTGTHVTDLTTVHNCTGLAVDSYNKKLYVAETGPAHIISMNYEGDSHKKIIFDQHQLQAPLGLAIFEDYIYYLAANTVRLGRCRMYGRKNCEVYSYRFPKTNKFVIRHENIQRQDLRDACEEVVCPNVCALDDFGPKCICGDGSFARNGYCPELHKKLLPVFSGSAKVETKRDSISYILVTAILVLGGLYICVFLYYHVVVKPRRLRGMNYSEVHFRNTTEDGSPTGSTAATIQLGASTTSTLTGQEFVNPIQFVKNMYYTSFRKRRTPTGMEAFNERGSPPQNDLSDTESDIDVRERNRLFS